MRVFAPAKVNLALHVTGRRSDGYHLLDSLVVFVGVGDWVTVAPADDLRLSVIGPKADGVPTDHRNLVWQAADLMGERVHITLEKHLPRAGGIGGGSADAAATLRGLSELKDIALPDAEKILALGADVPVCVAAASARMRGIGDILDPVPPMPPLWVVLVNAGAEVPTGPVFKALDSVDNAPLPRPVWSTADDVFNWLAGTRNDLEPSACALVPVIDTVLAAVAATDQCALARMSGSGGTCFGLFRSEGAANAAARALSLHQPEWWVKAAPILRNSASAIRPFS